MRDPHRPRQKKLEEMGLFGVDHFDPDGEILSGGGTRAELGGSHVECFKCLG